MLLLFGMFYLSVGCFASVLTKNQIIAAVISFCAITLLFFMGLIQFILLDVSAGTRELLGYFSALEQMGMVERKPHPTDGRQVHIALTAQGAAVRKSAKDAKRTWLAQAVAQLDEQDRVTLFKAAEIIRRLAEK